MEYFDDGSNECFNGGFDTMQVCLNGHTITDVYRRLPQFNEDFCKKCGQPTVACCANCKAEIRGLSMNTMYMSLGEDGLPQRTPPAFCRNCGKPYPWTEARLQAARELAELSESLSDEEKGLLKTTLNDIVSDNPRTTVAAMKLKQLLTKAGGAVADGMRSILVEVATEAAKKTLWPS